MVWYFIRKATIAAYLLEIRPPLSKFWGTID